MVMSVDQGRIMASRRAVLLGIAAGGVALLTPDLSMPQADAEGETLIFLTWGGDFGNAVRTAFSDPFHVKTGATIQDITPFSLGKFLTAMENGNPEGYDLVWFDDEAEPFQAGTKGQVEKLNYELIPNASHVIESVRQPYSVSPYVEPYQAVYRTDVYQDKAPNSWADFWDVEQFPGARSFGTWVGGVLEASLMADGVAPADLYPLDEKRAFAKLDQLKPNIRVFHDTQQAQQIKDMVAQGEIDMALTWSTDFIKKHLAGEPMNAIYNQGFYFSPAVSIAKGTKHLELAHAYLNMLLDADAQRRFVKAWLTSPSNPAAADALTEEQRMAVVIGNIDNMVHLNAQYYAENVSRIQEMYDGWRVQ